MTHYACVYRVVVHYASPVLYRSPAVVMTHHCAFVYRVMVFTAPVLNPAPAMVMSCCASVYRVVVQSSVAPVLNPAPAMEMTCCACVCYSQHGSSGRGSG